MAWSGGKDSALALATLLEDPRYEVVALLTTVTADYDRVSIHGVRRSLLHAQAAALTLPLEEAVIRARASNVEYDAAMASALERLGSRFPAARTVAFGDLFLEDIRAYREERLGAVGLAALFPLWGRETAGLANEFVRQGHRAVVVCVDSEALAPEFSGREFDAAFIRDLPAGVDPCGERGEFHTFVYAGPTFSTPIAVRRGETVVRDGRFVYCDLLESVTQGNPMPTRAA
jgi:uncharacterized protein (TIGR00290 family)